MAEDFKTFMSFTEPEMAQEIVAILTEGKILHNIHDSRKDFDPGMGNNESGKSIDIQVRPQDFPKAVNLINEKLELDESQIDPEHFLFGFTNDELIDVIKHADEWHPLDVKLAKHILNKNGVVLSQDDLETLQKKRIEEKAKPEKNAAEWIVIGYIFALGGGFLGFFIGYHLAHFKKTLPDGSQVYSYHESDRRNGNRILLLSAISLLGWIAFYIWKAK
ncbi:MAG TPA: hypothetical protein VK528_04370 [Flavobacterium sp.]|nr:hypothetical protein [Flavobacterium sp.]